MLLVLVLAALWVGYADFILTGEIQLYTTSDSPFNVADGTDAGGYTFGPLDFYGRPTLTGAGPANFGSWWRSNSASKTFPYSMNFVGSSSPFKFDRIAPNNFRPDATASTLPPHPAGTTWSPFTLRVRGVVSSTVNNLPVISTGDFAMYDSTGNKICSTAGVSVARASQAPITCNVPQGMIHIFFAHRAPSVAPQLSISLPASSTPTGCSVASQQIRANDIYPFSLANLNNPGGAISVTNPASGPVLNVPTGIGGANAVWSSTLIRPSNGFQTSFQFSLTNTGSNNAEGFAVVIQGNGPLAQGDAGHQLGYNIPSSLAIEFDTSTDAGFDTAAAPQHIDVHTAYTGKNDAGTQNLAGTSTSLGSVSTSGKPQFNFSSGATYEVSIEYFPTQSPNPVLVVYVSQPNQLLSAGTTWNSRTGSNLVLTVNVNHPNFVSMFTSKLGWIGFTSSASSNNPNMLKIWDWRVFQVPVAPLMTKTTPATFSTDIARNSASGPVITFSLFDACNSPIPTGGDAVNATLHDQLTMPTGSGMVMPVTSNNDGTYKVWYYYTLAQTSPINFYVQVNGEPTNISPTGAESFFPVTITPAPIAAFNCTATAIDANTGAAISNLITYKWLASSNVTIYVMAKDQFGNNNNVTTSGFTVSFANQAPFSPVSSTGNRYTFTPVFNNLALPGQTLFIKFNGLDINGGVPYSPITVLPDILPDVVNSAATAAGNGLTFASVNTPTTVTFNLKDHWSNQITDLAAGGFSGGLDAIADFRCAVAAAGCNPPNATVQKLATNPPSFSVTYQTTIAGLFNLSIWITHAYCCSPGTTQMFPLYQPSIAPGPEAAKNSIEKQKTGTPYVVGAIGTISIQAVDNYGNNRTTPNENNGGTPFSVRLGTAPNAVIVPCDNSMGTNSPEVHTVSCHYVAAGVVQVSFEPQYKELMAVAVSQPGVDGTWTVLPPVDVQPASVCAPCDILAFPSPWTNGSVFSLVAGTSASFTVNDYDFKGNPRLFSDDGSLYVLKLNPLAGQSSTTVSVSNYTALGGPLGSYTLTGNTTGIYNLTVKLLGTDIANSGAAVTITPNYTRIMNSFLVGPGLTGGVESTTAWFTLQAVDYFMNINNYTDQVNDPNSDALKCSLTFPPASPDYTTCHANFIPNSQGMWNISYDIPAYDPTKESFTLTLEMNPKMNPALQTRVLNLFLTKDGNQNFAMLYDTINTQTCPQTVSLLGTKWMAAQNNYLWLRHHGTIQACQNTSKLSPLPSWLLKFNPQAGSPTALAFTGGPNMTSQVIPGSNGAGGTPPCTAVSSPTCYAESMYFYAQKVGMYDVQVFAGGLETDQSLGNSGSGPKLTIKIVPGIVYAPRCYVSPSGALDGLQVVAGTTHNFDLVLSDFEGNLLSEPENSATTLNPVIAETVAGLNQNLSVVTFTSTPHPTDASILQYTINAIRAGDLSVFINIPPSVGATLAESKANILSVVPAELATACFVTSLAKPDCLTSITPNAVAGNLATIFVKAQDRFGNNLVDPTIKFGLKLQNNPGATLDPTVSTQFVSKGVYQVTFTATKTVMAGTIEAVYNGATVNNPACTITVDPNDIDPTTSWVEGLDVNGTAGTMFTFSLFARDRYNNSWTFAIDPYAKLDIILSGPLGAKKGVTGLNVILYNTVNPDGIFQYMWRPSIASPTVPYILSISATGAGVGAIPVTYTANLATPPMPGLTPFYVEAGPPYAVKTVYPFFANRRIDAGSNESYLISLVDQYGNMILKGGYTLTVDFYLGATPDCTSDAQPNDAKKVNERFFPPYASDQGNGSFLINIYSYNATYYYPWVQINEAVMSSNPSLGTEVAGGTCVKCITSCPKIPTPFQIVPLAPNANTSYLTNGVISNPETATAGQPLTFDIVLLDKYYNPVQKGGWDLSYGDVTPNDASKDICGGDQNRMDGNWLYLAPTEIIDNGNGNYTAKWTATKARTVGAVLLLNNVYGDGAISAIEWPKCHNITILPWYVYYETIDNYWNISWPVVVAPTEGLEAEARFHGFDKFDNLVTYGEFNWTDLVSRNTTDNLAPYAFLVQSMRPQPDDSFQNADFIPHHPGDYNLLVHFNQESKYADQTKFPLKNPSDKKGYASIIPRSCAGRALMGLETAGNNYTCPDETCASSIAGCTGHGLPTGGSATPDASLDCSSSYRFCPDGRTCVAQDSECFPASPAPSAALLGSTVQCTTGKMCPDGSCQTDCSKVVIYSCLTGLPKRCPDGSCRASLGDCPTGITCQAGYVLCNTGHCVKSVSECAGFEMPSCPPEYTRCRDGTCKTNPLLCPSGITCPDVRPILCADRSCVSEVGLCRKPATCNPMTPYPCFDGSCQLNASSCPTPPTCGFTTPVLCEDLSCAATADDCKKMSRSSNPVQGMSCPAHLPYNCLDGSCAAHPDSCPVGVSCGTDSPVKCANAACSVASNVCPWFNCSAIGVPCPGGGCASHYSECPTSITCPLGYVRCGDGSCRPTCVGITRHPSTFCTYPFMNCPSHEGGFQCSLTGNDCPLSVSCPPTKPVRCVDRTCAMSVEFCKPTPSYVPGKKTCSSNSWADSGVDCSSMPGVTCPPNFPVKCWDESCRVMAADCPPEPNCILDASDPSKIKSYLCHDGSCARNLYDCAQPQPCSNKLAPVKCPASGVGATAKTCVATISQCPSLTNLSIQLQCSNNNQRCADGSCRGDKCPVLTCPHYIPVLCSDGKCTKDVKECNNAKTGCPPDKKRCGDGSCQSSCPGNPNCNGKQLCGDGSCQASCPSLSGGDSGCGSSQRCWDGNCPSSGSTCTSTSFGEDASLPNACPLQVPYKCPNGFCAVSSMACPVINQEKFPCASGAPVQCADGSCAQTGEQCPVIQPCTQGKMKCQSGHCVTDLSTCPSYNKCPANGVMCPNGLCAGSLSACLNMWTGCKNGTMKCADGRCMDTCPTTYPSGTGCTGTKKKCWNGECLDTCSPVPACNPADPASDSCTKTIAGSKTAWGCDVTTPVRCYDGSCAANAADANAAPNACKPGGGPNPTLDAALNAVVCPSTRPIVCRDGSCVALSSHCPAFLPCDGGRSHCVDMTCSTSCPTNLFCPAGSPTLCPDGSCRRVARECGALPGSNCTEMQVRCYDGSCGSKPTDCMAKNTAYKADSNVESVCPGGKLCWNGQCVRSDGSNLSPLYQTKYCPFVPACPASAPKRCPDGSCKNETVAACASATNCNGGIRCEDGSCRTTCLPYMGCNTTFPYYCPNSKFRCVKDKTACDLIAKPSVCPGNCKRDIVVFPTTVSVPATTSIKVDIAVNWPTNSPVTWLEIPSGTFSGAQQLSIWPISLQSLQYGQAKINGVFVDRTPQQILVSPAWQYTVTGYKSGQPFPLNFTVKSLIDRILYTSSEDGVVEVKTAPCSWRAKYTANFQNFACSGQLVIQDTVVSYQSNTDNSSKTCPTIDYTGTVKNSTDVDVGGNLYQCVCINVTQVGANASPEYAYKVGSKVCMNLLFSGDRYMYTSATLANAGNCYQVTDAATGGAAVSTQLELQTGSASADCSGGTAGLIAPNDICLGQFDPTPNPPIWSCILPSYTQRISHPVWTQDFGFMASMVIGQNPAWNNNVTQGFLYIPLPAPDIIQPEGQSWWQKYGKIVLGVTISMFILLLILAYAISRLIRYREKYLVEKRDAAALREEAQELDEKHGGLGVYDEEVEMIANPLVVQMQELQKQLEQTNASLSTQEELDATQMAAMDKERQRILEEIKRVKEAIAAQKKSTPTANYDAPATNPTAAAPAGTTAAQPATSERQEFVQSAPPRRKKQEF